MRRYFVDAAQIFSAQFHFQCAGVLFQVLAALRAGDRNDVLALGKQPCKRELAGRAFLFFGNGFDTANKIEVLLEVFSLEARRIPAVIVGRKILEAFDLAGEKAAAVRVP